MYKSRQILRNHCPSFSKILHSILLCVYQSSIEEPSVPNNRVSQFSELRNRNSFSHGIEDIKDEEQPHSLLLPIILHCWPSTVLVHIRVMMLRWLNPFFFERLTVSNCIVIWSAPGRGRESCTKRSLKTSSERMTWNFLIFDIKLVTILVAWE